MDSTDLREQIHTMLAAGLKQRQIAVTLGIGQATVSDHKRALVAAGRLPAAGAAPRGTVVELVPARRTAGRSRTEILLEHADLKAATLRSAARTLVERVVGADEWVTDSDYRAQVRAVVADAVVEVIEHLKHVNAEFGLAAVAERSVAQEGAR